jgi:hypothetical protein
MHSELITEPDTVFDTIAFLTNDCFTKKIKNPALR